MPTAARHARLAFVLAVICFLAPSWPCRTAAAQVAPLTSVALDDTLLAAGFTPEQRAAVLAEHAAYVSRFVQQAEGPLAQWIVATGGTEDAEEKAREAVRSARAAGSAIEALEQPIHAAILSVATPAQQGAAQRAVDLLTIRLERSLVESAPQERGFFGMMSTHSRTRDPITMLERLDLTAEQRAAIQPLVDGYIPACRDSLRRERIAAAESPALRSASARQGGPEFEGVPMDAEGKPDIEAMRQHLRDVVTQAKAQRDAALRDRREASEKSLRAEFALIDSVLPMLSGREQARLLAEWSRGIRVGPQGSPSRLGPAWKESRERTAGQLAQLDAACAAWVQAWWPKAQPMAFEANQSGGSIMMPGADPAMNDAATKRRESMAKATDEAVAQIAAILGVTVEEMATRNRVGRGLPGLPGPGISPDANGDAPQGAVVVMSTITTATAVDGGGDGASFTFEGEIPDGAFEDASGLVGHIEGEVFEIMSDVGDVSISIAESDDEGDGLAVPTGLTIMAGPSAGGRLPRRVEWEKVLPFYTAVEVGEAMLPVGQAMWNTLNEDLASLFAREKEMINEGRTAELESLRAECAAFVTSRVAELNDTIVPVASQQAAAWIPGWASGDFTPSPTSFGSMAIDPGSVALASDFAKADWLAAGPVLTTMGSTLASVNRMAREADARLERHFARYQQPDYDPNVQGPEMAEENQRLFNALHASTEATEQAYASAMAQIMAALNAQPASRFQDALDDRRFKRKLHDPSSLATRFEKALALDVSEPQRQSLEALRASWTTQARGHRDAIVSFLDTNPIPAGQMSADRALAARRDAGIAALGFARDEANRSTFRAMQSLLPPELAGKLPPLPAPRSRAPQGQMAFQSFQVGG